MTAFNRYLGVPGAGEATGQVHIPNSTPLAPEETAFRPEALRILQEHESERPKTRAECRQNGDRPCPWVSCKFHLFLDVNPETGTLKLNFPDKEVWELTESCALDVVEQQGGWDPRTARSEPMTSEATGDVIGVAKSRVVQLSQKFATTLRKRGISP